jgi:phosphopantothenoylcysteine decarboxylase/phosphopantothenate--cysteine ligase
MSVAEKVAKASSEGGFLGFGGEQVTAAEKALIEEIRLALGAAASEIKEDKVTTGDLGPGRKMQPKVGANVKAKATITSRPLLGRKVMITAGPTQEPIDMTHFIVNHSSGEQGYLLAEVAVALGAETVLVSGPVNLPLPPGAQVRMANTASDMLEICEQELPCDIAIFAAAVSKWRMAGSPEKLEVQIGGVRQLKLIENPDISKIIATRTDKRPAIVIELTTETADVIENSRKKLLTKSCDLILVHDVGDSSGMFRADSNTLHLISAHQVETWPRLSKREVAQRLMAMLAAKLAPR